MALVALQAVPALSLAVTCAGWVLVMAYMGNQTGRIQAAGGGRGGAGNGAQVIHPDKIGRAILLAIVPGIFGAASLVSRVCSKLRTPTFNALYKQIVKRLS